MIKPSQKVYLFFKRLIDIFGALIGLLILSPLLIVLAIATKISSKGPVLFRQKRLGRNKKPFMFYKFRSMRVDALQIPPDEMTPKQQESMTTKWGRFIRRTSLDELPQLFNILFGQMSFIGPRPSQDEQHEGELVRERESFIPNPYLVKPGLSGYSQVMLHRNHNYKAKARYDSYYVENLGLRMDIRMFVMSLLVAFGFDKGR